MGLYFARPENVPEDLDARLVLDIRQHFHNEVHIAALNKSRLLFESSANEDTLIQKSCSFAVLVFLAFPDGKIHYRHLHKIEKAFLTRRCVYEAHMDGSVSIIYRHCNLYERALSRYETATRIWHDHRYMIPFLQEDFTAR